MVRYAFVAFAGLAAALPLNINLGAYSPALVVGDGEISFGGEQDVSSLMNVLEGAAVNTAASVANNAAAAAAVTPPATNAAADTAGDKVVSAAADPALTEQAQQIASLQGLGKEIAPRMQLVDVETEEVDVDVEDTASENENENENENKNKNKRDLAGFDRALTFAEAALTKGPKIQLGTGKEGSGVGIVVDNNPEAAARAGKAKRDLAPAPKRVRAKVTTMYVRSGIPASLQSKTKRDSSLGSTARSVPAAAAAFGRRDAIDGLNLNVDGEQGLTMTFVETVDE